MGEWDENQKTVPDLFAEPAPTDELPDETTKRRCAGCGMELPRDDAAFRAGGVAVLESLFAALVDARVGIDSATAARVVQAVARDSGITLV